MTEPHSSDHSLFWEIVIPRDGQEPLRGHAWIAQGVLTVTTLDGRQQSTVAKHFGVDPGSVQRISRPFDGVSEAA